MAKEYFIEIDGKRTVAKAFDHLPNVGDTVMVTHDQRVLDLVDRVFRMEDGKLTAA